MINKGDYIQCFLNSSALVEGLVEEFNDDFIKLLCEDKSSYIIIYNPKENITFIKVSKPKPLLSQLKDNEEFNILNKEFEDELNNIPQNTEELDLKNAKLAQLKILLNKKEKEIIFNKLKSHSPGEIKGVKYEQPRFKK